jgi:glycerol dehydrogenase
MATEQYVPGQIFTVPGQAAPRVMIAPQRYIQGEGVIDHLGRYISLLNTQRACVLASSRGHKAEGLRVMDSLKQRNISGIVSTFDGECSLEEVDMQVAALKDQNLDCLIAVGGGKCVDAGKCIAYRLDIPVVIVPTLASNDAPCSALSVMYSPEGVNNGVEFFPDSPALVVMDTGVVANASERFLAAGMGDAMATWYEAKACLANPVGRNSIGSRPTLACAAMGETCAHTLYEYGVAASASVVADRCDDALERIVEANTLLSGIGFESGGCAAAHAVAMSYTHVKAVHDNYLHGEMVAMGTLTQLMMEQNEDARKAAEFFARVGLPIHLGQISLTKEHSEDIDTVTEAAMALGIMHNMPMTVTPELIRSSMLSAHELGVVVAKEVGDEAYRRLQGE